MTPMSKRYKLIAGYHVGPDMTKPKGPNGRHPSREYKPGEVIESEVDLVKVMGENKFQYLDSPPPEHQGKEAITPAVAAAPMDTRAPHPEPPRASQLAGPIPPTTGTQPGEDEAQARYSSSGESDQPNEQDQDGVSPWDQEYGTLEDKTVTDLKELAAMEKIEIQGCRTKDDLIKRIRSTTKNR